MTMLHSGAADLERRFGGLKRLWGAGPYDAVRSSRVAVVGLGGVGSWAAEALARCGVAELVLIDLDHVAESNINRQIQALDSTLGVAKVQALQARVGQIHPGCKVHAIEEFVEPQNWPQLLPSPVDVVIDACDQSAAKFTLAAWALDGGSPLVTVGAAGGKYSPERVEVADLTDVTHDPMLARLRQRLRQRVKQANPEGSAAQPLQAGASVPRVARLSSSLHVTCVFSREEIRRPEDSCSVDGSLNCAGYGSSVMVTATFGMVAAEQALSIVRRSAASLDSLR